MHSRRTTCRVCEHTGLQSFLTLGSTPLANAFLRTPDDFADERTFPLELFLCPGCSLVQLIDVIDPAVLFRHYLYVSGTSETVAAHNRGMAATLCDRLRLGATDLVVEVASNDGSLLTCFKELGVRALGIEPARNIASAARAAGVETVEEFFDADVAAAVRASHGPASAIVANNVLAHVDDPRAFLAAARSLLAPHGVIVVEVPYLGDLVDRLEYDTVYHEHLSYFSVTSLLALARRAGLVVSRVDRVAVHGGSLRVWFEAGGGETAPGPDVLAFAGEEQRNGLGCLPRYVEFAERVQQNRRDLVDLLEGLAAEGRRVAGYGAPAKGNTLLNFCGIDARLISYIVDKNPLKVGMYTPGMHIQVKPVSALRDDPPDYLVILAWNFADEIMRQQNDYRACGGQFIVPIPQPIVV